MHRVVILTTSTGAGHNQVAGVLKQELENHDCEVRVVDFLHETHRWMEGLIAGGYNNIAVRAHTAYGFLYRVSNNRIFNAIIHFLLVFFLNRPLERIIRDIQPDLIIATHAMSLGAIGFLKKNRKIGMPLVSIITDFDAHALYAEPMVDAYISPSAHSSQMLIDRGIDPQRIHLFGIPIRREFHQACQPTIPEKSQDLFTILLMGGSAGQDGIVQTVRAIMQSPEKLRLIVVCGRNEEMKTALDQEYSGYKADKDLIIRGFVKEIPQLMDQADVLFTKPGGITVSEALSKQLPIVIPFCIAGQEEENAQILARAGVAIRLESIRHIPGFLGTITGTPGQLDEIRANIGRFRESYSIENTIQLCLNLIGPARIER